jgi:hypothetical protein
MWLDYFLINCDLIGVYFDLMTKEDLQNLIDKGSANKKNVICQNHFINMEHVTYKLR